MNHVRTTTHVDDPSEIQLFYCADQTEARGINFLRGAMKQFQILAYALLCLTIGLAQASAEWKLYGGASDKGGHVICFFDADSVAKAVRRSHPGLDEMSCAERASARRHRE